MPFVQARRPWITPVANRYGTFAELTLQRGSKPGAKDGGGVDAWCANPSQAQSPDGTCEIS